MIGILRTRSGCALALTALAVFTFSSNTARAGTIVQFNTSAGPIQVKLTDHITPETVENFLSYVSNGRYTNSIFHRSVSDFVVQGGGFSNQFVSVPTDAPVVNEFYQWNTFGTIAMAKLGGDANSATSQWFFSLGDNRENLDNQNGGFTVFGRVVRSDLDLLTNDDVNAPDLAQYKHGDFRNATYGIPASVRSAMSELPVLDSYTQEEYSAGVALTPADLVTVNSVSVIGTWTPDWHDFVNPFDMNGDGIVEALDALLLIDESKRGGFRELDTPFVGPLQLDVDANGAFDQYDIERVFEKIKERPVLSTLSLAESDLAALSMNEPEQSFSLMSARSFSFSAVPEPASAMLGLTGAMLFGAMYRRFRVIR